MSLDYNYEPRVIPDNQNTRLLREAKEIEDALRGDVTLSVNRFNMLLTALLKLIKK